MKKKKKTIEKKKKIKIIQEIFPKFKEIEPRSNEKEEKEIVDSGEMITEDFFIPSHSATPTLEPTEPPETLEDSVEEAIRERPTSNNEGEETTPVYEASIYNMPDYGANNYETPIVREMREASVLIRPENINETKTPQVRIEEWHELKETQQTRRMPEDRVLKVGRLKEERKLPFEEKRKYRDIREEL